MPARFGLLGAALPAVSLAPLFGGHPGSVHAQAVSGRKRVAHMATQDRGIDGLVDGQRKVSDLMYRSAGDYLPLAPGAHTLQLSPVRGSACTLLRLSLIVQP